MKYVRKIQCPFELDLSDVKLLNSRAEELRRSKSGLIRQLIREHLREIVQ
jgi:hypothetical protein